MKTQESIRSEYNYMKSLWVTGVVLMSFVMSSAVSWQVCPHEVPV